MAKKVADKPPVVVMQGRGTPVDRKRIVLLAAAVLVIGLIGVVGLSVYNIKHDNDLAKKAKLQTQQQIKAADGVNEKVFAKDYDGAIQDIKSRNDQSRPTLLQLISVYMNKGDYANALATYDQIEANGQLRAGDAESMAELYVQKGDKTKAIAYYNTAITLAKKENGPSVEYKVPELQAKIQELSK